MITKDDMIRFCTSFDKLHNELRTYVLASKVADELDEYLIKFYRDTDYFESHLLLELEKLIQTLRAKEQKKE